MTQTASVQDPFQTKPLSGPTPTAEYEGNREPLRCFDSRLQWWSRQMPTTTWPKTYVIVDMVRQDRCRGRRVSPAPRLHGFLVMSDEKLSLGLHMRGNKASPLVQLCQSLMGNCLDVEFELYWRPHWGPIKRAPATGTATTTRYP